MRAISRWSAFGLLMLAIAAGEVVFFTLWDIPFGWSPRATAATPPGASGLTGVALGSNLFNQHRCADCHGVAGSGGVPNPNYIGGAAPALNLMAERLMLFDEEDADWVVSRIEEGSDPSAHEGAPPFRTYTRFQAQLQSVRSVLENGSIAGMLDPHGVHPRDMPSWAARMTRAERDALIAYLISLYDWED